MSPWPAAIRSSLRPVLPRKLCKTEATGGDGSPCYRFAMIDFRAALKASLANGGAIGYIESNYAGPNVMTFRHIVASCGKAKSKELAGFFVACGSSELN